MCRSKKHLMGPWKITSFSIIFWSMAWRGMWDVFPGYDFRKLRNKLCTCEAWQAQWIKFIYRHCCLNRTTRVKLNYNGLDMNMIERCNNNYLGHLTYNVVIILMNNGRMKVFSPTCSFLDPTLVLWTTSREELRFTFVLVRVTFL